MVKRKSGAPTGPGIRRSTGCGAGGGSGGGACSCCRTHANVSLARCNLEEILGRAATRGRQNRKDRFRCRKAEVAEWFAGLIERTRLPAQAPRQSQKLACW